MGEVGEDQHRPRRDAAPQRQTGADEKYAELHDDGETAADPLHRAPPEQPAASGQLQRAVFLVEDVFRLRLGLEALDDGKAGEQILGPAHEALAGVAEGLFPPGQLRAEDGHPQEGQHAEHHGGSRHRRTVGEQEHQGGQKIQGQHDQLKQVLQIVGADHRHIAGEDGQIPPCVLPGKGGDALFGEPPEGVGLILAQRPAQPAAEGPVVQRLRDAQEHRYPRRRPQKPHEPVGVQRRDGVHHLTQHP